MTPFAVIVWLVVGSTLLTVVLLGLLACQHTLWVRAARRRERIRGQLEPVFAQFVGGRSAELEGKLRPLIDGLSRQERPVMALLVVDAVRRASPDDQLALRAVFDRVGIVALAERGTRRFSPWRRVLACEVLGNIGLSHSVPVLVGHLDDRRPEVRAAAVRAIGALGSSAAAPALESAFLERRCAPSNVVSDALRRLGRPGRDAFIRGCRSSDPIVRVSSCFGLAATAALDRATAHEQLGTLLRGDPDAGVRAAAANALGIAGGTTVSAELLAAAGDHEVGVRRAAVRALGAFDDPRAAETLAGCTDDDDRETAIRAAESLFELAGRAAAAAVAEAHLDESDDWSVAYARTIAEVSQQADDSRMATA